MPEDVRLSTSAQSLLARLRNGEAPAKVNRRARLELEAAGFRIQHEAERNGRRWEGWYYLLTPERYATYEPVEASHD